MLDWPLADALLAYRELVRSEAAVRYDWDLAHWLLGLRGGAKHPPQPPPILRR